MRVRCPECTRLISDTASACPRCGYAITPAMAERMRTAATMPLYRRRSTWLTWGIAALMIAAAAYCGSRPERPPTQCEETQMRAVRILSGLPEDARLPSDVRRRIVANCQAIDDYDRDRR